MQLVELTTGLRRIRRIFLRRVFPFYVGTENGIDIRLTLEHQTDLFAHVTSTDRHFLSRSTHSLFFFRLLSSVQASAKCNLDSIVTAKHSLFDFNHILHLCAEHSV